MWVALRLQRATDGSMQMPAVALCGFKAYAHGFDEDTWASMRTAPVRSAT